MRASLSVNGEPVDLDLAPDARLLDVLRDRLGLLGTKRACGRGECGACTVLIDGRPRLSCVELAVRAGRVETIEGLAEESAGFRQAMADTGGFQCGYCTPGQVVRAVALLRAGLPADDPTLRRAISGNLCRCTGYDAIVAAYRQAEAAARASDAQTATGATGPEAAAHAAGAPGATDAAGVPGATDAAGVPGATDAAGADTGREG